MVKNRVSVRTTTKKPNANAFRLKAISPLNNSGSCYLAIGVAIVALLAPVVGDGTANFWKLSSALRVEAVELEKTAVGVSTDAAEGGLLMLDVTIERGGLRKRRRYEKEGRWLSNELFRRLWPISVYPVSGGGAWV
jgi:hypothetical protein